MDWGNEAIFSHPVLVVQTWWRFFSSFQYNTRPRPDFHIIVSTVSLDNSDMGHSLIKPVWCEISPKMWSSVHDMQATITCCACQLVSTALLSSIQVNCIANGLLLLLLAQAAGSDQPGNHSFLPLIRRPVKFLQYFKAY